MNFSCKALGLILLFGLLFSGCGTTSCDEKGMANQALDILLQEYKKTAKELGIYTSDVVLLDKESNVCQAKVNIKVVDEFNQWLESERKKANDDVGFMLAAAFALEKFSIYRLMGYNVALTSYEKYEQGGEYSKMIINEPEIEMNEVAKYTLYREILDKFSKSVIHYKVTSNDKGDEYIIAEVVQEK
ncbi:hypothetical protein [Helicobacter sp.]|uniref:hypothetical protein n=1 Tax=Helicobacter sp. TaxID=218 RepID=UPI0019A9FA09|nr:hypothetical protein [Helicobacter sp.]MBD5164437.1 hypothetical protein [Helicobacter sp.]